MYQNITRQKDTDTRIICTLIQKKIEASPEKKSPLSFSVALARGSPHD
jgi:hypothetical protein